MSRTAKLWMAGLLVVFALSFMVGCTRPDPLQFTFKVQKAAGGHGSGTHIGNRLVLTAAHVVEDSEEVELIRPDGTKLKAKTIWRSPEYDLAILRYEGPYIPSAQLACGRVAVGTDIRLIGNPGAIEHASFWGRVSKGIERVGPWRETQTVNVTGMPGVSGGGVFDNAGRLVGVLVAGYATPLAPISTIGMMVPASAYCQMVTRA